MSDLSALPGGYSVIVADPPWMYQKQPGLHGSGDGPVGTAERHYQTMTNEQIAALPVAGLARASAHLFMWVTNPGIYGGRFSDVTPADIAAAWGFEYKTTLTWVKTGSDGRPIGSGMGWYFRGCTEHVLYATRGDASISSERRVANVVLAPRGRHSAKPEQFFRIVEAVADGPYLEMFSRRRRRGWDSWGNDGALSDSVEALACEPEHRTADLFGLLGESS